MSTLGLGTFIIATVSFSFVYFKDMHVHVLEFELLFVHTCRHDMHITQSYAEHVTSYNNLCINNSLWLYLTWKININIFIFYPAASCSTHLGAQLIWQAVQSTRPRHPATAQQPYIFSFFFTRLPKYTPTSPKYSLSSPSYSIGPRPTSPTYESDCERENVNVRGAKTIAGVYTQNQFMGNQWFI